jgi:septum formation protein
MLTAAGLRFEAVSADIDEGAIRDLLVTDNPEIDPADIAEVLARAKAEAVSRARPGVLVIGSDQVLACDGILFEKPEDMAAAQRSLLALRGKVHQLHAAVVLAEDGETTWSHVATADLAVRPFSMAFLTEYLARVGDAVTESVGAYQLEGLGVQLFERIEGDYFTILGMPLLPLLGELRARGLAPQ